MLRLKSPWRPSSKEQMELYNKLVEADGARLSVEAGLKTIERQAEDQHKKLHIIEIELATQK